MASDRDLKLQLLIEAKDAASDELKRLQRQIGETSAATGELGREGKASGELLAGGFSRALGVAGALSAGVTAVVGALSALVVTSASEAREMKILADMAGMAVDEFAAFSYATGKVNINAEKLGDISKDVKDKLGDFIATGGGEFADFFENIAPKVGLTADELARLSGPEALIAIKKALDDSNASYSEQVFYLEAIANDASKLISLLAGNGEELRKNAERAKELGITLSEIDSQKLLDAKTATTEATAAFAGLKDKVAAEFAPVYTEVMRRAVDWTIGLRDEVLALSRGVAGFLDLMVGEKSEAETQLAGYQEKIAALYEKRDRRGAIAFTDEEQKLLHVYQAQLVQLKSVIALEERRKSEAAEPPVVKVTGGGAGTAGRTATAKEAADYVDSWRRAYPDRVELQTRALGVMVDNEAMAIKESERLAGEAAQRERALIAEGLAAARSDSFVDSWALQYQDRYEVQSRYLDLMIEAEKDASTQIENAIAGWASGFGQTLSDAMWDADASFKGIAESFGRMLTEMMVQYAVVQPMLEGLFGNKSMGTTGLLSGMGDWLGGLWPFAQGGVPGGTGLAPYRNQVVSQPTFFAFAQGGVFGEAGPEAIMPLTRTPGGDLGVRAIGGGVVNNINIIDQAGVAVQRTERPNGSGGVDIDLVLDKKVAGQINRHGSSTNRAIRSTTGAAAPLLRR